MSEANGGFRNRAYSDEDRDENENVGQGGVDFPNIVVYVDPAADDDGKVGTDHQNGGHSNGNGFLHPDGDPR